MGILDRLAGMFAPTVPSLLQVESRALDVGLSSLDRDEAEVLKAMQVAPSQTGLQLLGSIKAGQSPRRGTAELMLAYSRLPHLRSVVGRIAQAVGQVQWKIYRVPSMKTRMQLRSAMHAVRKSVFSTDQAVELERHEFLDLMQRFNPEMGGVAGRKLMQIHSDLKGDSFSIIERKGIDVGHPVELWPIAPQCVTLSSKVDGPFEVQYRSGRILVPRERMLYIRELDPFDPFGRGSGIGESLADELDSDEFASKHLKSWFLNRGIPSMLIGIEGIEDDEVKVARQDWEDRNRGPLRNNRVHFHNGKMNAVRLDDKFSDMQIVDLRKFAMQVVRETYNVPPELVGHLDNSNRATIEEALAIMAILIVQPRLEVMRTEMQAQLIPLYADGDQLVIDYEDPIPADRRSVLEASKAAEWALSMNEWRGLQGFGPLEGGDDLHMVNGAMINVSSKDTADVVTLNELTLGIQRLGGIGDIDGLNALRTALATRLGTSLSPVDALIAPTNAPQPGEAASGKDADEVAVLKVFSRKSLTTAGVEEVVQEINREILSKQMTPVETTTVNFFGEDMTEELSKSWSRASEPVLNFLAQFSSERIKMINNTTREEIRKTLISSVGASESIPTIARKIREQVDGMTAGRAKTIARTEVNRAANFAREHAMVNESWPNKRWVTQMDGRERKAHREMNGQVVPVGRAFTAPSGAKARYPGAFPSASLNINCRCTIVAAREQKSIDDVTVWRSFDRQLARHEKMMEDAFVRGLREQEAALLRRLERFT